MPKEIRQEIRKKILRYRGVMTTTGLARSTIYLRMAEGTFPRPISLGGRAVGWLEEEVEDWLSTQIARSREGAGS
jgi:prophage regulatory protein